MTLEGYKGYKANKVGKRVYPTFPYADPAKQAEFQKARQEFPKLLKKAQEDLIKKIEEFIEEAPKHSDF